MTQSLRNLTIFDTFSNTFSFKKYILWYTLNKWNGNVWWYYLNILIIWLDLKNYFSTGTQKSLLCPFGPFVLAHLRITKCTHTHRTVIMIVFPQRGAIRAVSLGKSQARRLELLLARNQATFKDLLHVDRHGRPLTNPFWWNNKIVMPLFNGCMCALQHCPIIGPFILFSFVWIRLQNRVAVLWLERAGILYRCSRLRYLLRWRSPTFHSLWSSGVPPSRWWSGLARPRPPKPPPRDRWVPRTYPHFF